MYIKNKILSIFQSRYFILAVFLTSVLIIIIFLLNSFVVKGKIASALFYPQAQFMQLKKNLESTKNNLSACLVQLEDSRLNATKLETNLSIALTRIETLEEEVEQLNQTIILCQTNLAQTTQSIQSIRSDYDSLAYNSAVNICCKRKLDEPNLDHFYVKDNTIFCVAGYNETLKTVKFTCPTLT